MRHTPHSRGFTLTEILVVVGIIVVVLGISVPVFRVLSGNKSTGTARNQVSSILSLARGEALGLEQTSGVMFYIDPVTRRTAAVLVREAPRPANVGGTTYAADANISVYLELVPNREPLLLPGGVGLQTYINSGVITGSRMSDGYMGFNTAARTSNDSNITTSTPFGGVILFDRRGVLTSRSYAFRTNVTSGTNVQWTAMGELLFGVNPGAASGYRDVRPGNFASSAGGNFQSQIGFALFDSGLFEDTFGANATPDVAVSGGTYGSASDTGTNEASEEAWLDKNSLPNVVGRYNGTVISAQ